LGPDLQICGAAMVTLERGMRKGYTVAATETTTVNIQFAGPDAGAEGV